MKIIEENPTNQPSVNTPPTRPVPPAAPTPPPPPKNYTRAGNIYLGVVLALVGLLWCGYNYNIIYGFAADVIFSVWMLLIAIGGYLLTLRKNTAGLIVILVGAVMLFTDTFDYYISFSKIILPAVLILIGVLIILSQTKRKK